MRMINVLTEGILDSTRFVEAIKEREQEVLKQARQEAENLARSILAEGRPGENRTERRARERMERKAQKRAVKV